VIVLGSVFRDSVGYLSRHEDQVERLRKTVDEPVYVVAVEGDSSDDTYERLAEMVYVDEILKVEHGGPKFPSVVHPLRWRQLAVACNATVCAAVRVCEPGDRFVYVESDLIWEPETVCRLLDRLTVGVHGVAPLSMCWEEARFYDVWGYEQDGRRFSPYPPYYPGWSPSAEELVPIDSSGSCFVLDTAGLRVVEFSAQDCIKGIGRSLAANGMQLFLDPTVKVFHP
jgi:hypothetical protein